MSKAYIYQNYEGGAIVFFESSQGQAKSHVIYGDYATEDDYTDIRVKRVPKLDYMNKPDGYELDWRDPIERRAMVEHTGMVCLPYDDDLDCDFCSASDICDTYKDIKEFESKKEENE